MVGSSASKNTSSHSTSTVGPKSAFKLKVVTKQSQHCEEASYWIQSLTSHLCWLRSTFFWLAVLNRCFLEKLLLLLSNYWNPHLKHDTLLLKELFSSNTVCPFSFKQEKSTAVKTGVCWSCTFSYSSGTQQWLLIISVICVSLLSAEFLCVKLFTLLLAKSTCPSMSFNLVLFCLIQTEIKMLTLWRYTVLNN